LLLNFPLCNQVDYAHIHDLHFQIKDICTAIDKWNFYAIY
jgi:hypothetical protein